MGASCAGVEVADRPQTARGCRTCRSKGGRDEREAGGRRSLTITSWAGSGPRLVTSTMNVTSADVEPRRCPRTWSRRCRRSGRRGWRRRVVRVSGSGRALVDTTTVLVNTPVRPGRTWMVTSASPMPMARSPIVQTGVATSKVVPGGAVTPTMLASMTSGSWAVTSVRVVRAVVGHGDRRRRRGRPVGRSSGCSIFVIARSASWMTTIDADARVVRRVGVALVERAQRDRVAVLADRGGGGDDRQGRRLRSEGRHRPCSR